MAGFNSVLDLVNAEVEGRHLISTWRKAPTQATAAGYWMDLAMSPGNPAPFYYASTPLESVSMSRSNGGLNHGIGNVSPSVKVLRKMAVIGGVAAPLPMPMIVCDYLMYYPFIDESLSGDIQSMTQTATLPRYTDGEGVRIMAVVVAGHATGGATFTCSYTNQAGISGRTTVSATLNNQFVNGTIITSAPATSGSVGPFLALQDGDTGVRSIESVTMSGVDVGLFTLVLVKPLGQFSLRGIDAPVDIDYFKDFGCTAPIINDGAYLNILACPAGSLSGAGMGGIIEVSWG